LKKSRNYKLLDFVGKKATCSVISKNISIPHQGRYYRLLLRKIAEDGRV